MNFNKIITATALCATLTFAGTASGAPAQRNVPTNAGIENAAVHAAAAGINLLNTIKSDAGKGNGPELSDPIITETVTQSSTTTESTEVINGTPVITSSTESNVISTGPVSDWTRVDQGHGNVYKKYQDVTTEEITTQTTTTPVTTNTYETTNNYETTTTTTSFDELDPGKSAPVNNSPEEGAPDPVSVTGDPVLVSTSDPVLTNSTNSETVVETVISDTIETEQTTVDVCNKSDPNAC